MRCPTSYLERSGSRSLSQFPVNQDYPIGVHAEPAAFFRNVVGDNQVQRLAAYLIGGVGFQVFAFR